MAGIVEGLRKIRVAIARAIARLIGGGNTEAGDVEAGDQAAGKGLTSSSKDANSTAAPQLYLNPRRYKRAMLLTGAGGIQQQIASASAQFRGKPHSVVDLSHTGVAIERGDLKESDFSDTSKSESMVLNVGRLEPFAVQVTLARHSETVLAFEFMDIATEGRLTIDRFLDPKMIGLNMRAVDRSFFSPGETFTLWFCGPRDTNFFLWMNGALLERAIIQLGDEQFTLAPSTGHGRSIRFVRHNAPATASSTQTELRDSILFALDVALQVKGGADAISGLVKLLTEAADTPQSDT